MSNDRVKQKKSDIQSLPTYEVQVSTDETVTSLLILHVKARSPTEAESKASRNMEAWRNDKRCRDIKIAAREHIVQADLNSVHLTVRCLTPLVEASLRLEKLNQRLTNGVRLRTDGLWITASGPTVQLAVPEALQQEVRMALAGSGETLRVLAQKLSSYGMAEWERRFSNALPQNEPEADGLMELTDHTWDVLGSMT